MILSAILSLGNIEFEENDSDGCFIKIESEKFLCDTSALLDTNKEDLQDALISHTRIIGNQVI